MDIQLTDQKKKQINTTQTVSQSISMGNQFEVMKKRSDQYWAKDKRHNGDIPAPSEKEVIAAHKDVGLSLQPGSVKHPYRVKRAAKKLELQQRILTKSTTKYFGHKYDNQLQEHFTGLDVSALLYAKEKKNLYETLLEHYDDIRYELNYIKRYEELLSKKENGGTNEEKAKLATLKDVQVLFDLHERLMTNKYYVMLPHAEMHKLSSDELQKRLESLYQDKNKNEELINYYQDLFRLKELGLSDTKSVNSRQKKYLDQLEAKEEKKENKEEKPKDPVKEMKSIQEAYTALKKSLSGSALTVGGTEARLLRNFFKIYGSDLDTYKVGLTPEQLNAKAKFPLSQILDEYRQYKEKKENAEAKTEDDELEEILKETDEDADAIAADDGKGAGDIQLSKEQKDSARQADRLLFNKALSDDQLSFGTTLFNMKEEERFLVYYMVEKGKTAQSLSSEDFFTVMNTYVPNPELLKKADWKALSMAVRTYKPTFQDIVEFAKLEKESNEAIEPAEKDLQEKHEIMLRKREEYSRTVEERKNSLANAIQKKLDLVSFLYSKAKMPFSMPPDMAKDPALRERLVLECDSLMRLGVELDSLSQVIKDAKEAKEKGTGVEEKALETGLGVDAGIPTFLAATSTVSGIMGAGAVFNDMKIGAAYYTTAYQGFSNMKDGLFSILGFLMAIHSSATIAKDASMSAADRTAQAMGAGGSMISSLAGAVSGIYSFTLRGISEEALTQAQQLARGTIGTVAAGAMILAGGVSMASSAIQIGRALSTEKDIKKARQTLSQKDQTKLTRDEKILSRFLTHQTRDAKKQKAGASFDMVTGALGVVSGALMLAGPVGFAPLAVLAFVGIGLSIAKIATTCTMKKKNRQAAVDDFLQLDKKFQKVLEKKKEIARNNGDNSKINESKLKEAVRKDALAKLGFTNYMDCFRAILAQAAELLYDKNFVHPPKDAQELEMYRSALDSVGLKKSKKKVEGEAPHPTAAEIYKKLLSAS